MNKTHDISQLYPQWQFRLREAVENLNTTSLLMTDAQLEALNARGKARSQGRDLLFVLTHIFGIPVVTPSLNHNFYTVDGYWFSLKQESIPGEDEKQPVHSSTSGARKGDGMVSFTLYVGKVVADVDFPDWPQRQVIVGRDVHLVNTGYSRLRAALAEALDELETGYRDAIPRYQAWKELQLLPTDAAMRQDFLLQLIRRALREMPAAELLPTPISEPVEVPQAMQEESQACMDGLLLATVEQAEEVTLASLEVTANRIISLLDDLLPSNYDPFDDDDEPDDEDEYEDDDYDDLTEPPYPDQDPAVKPHDDDFDEYDFDDDDPDDDDEVDEETISPDLDDATEPDTEKEAVPV